MTPPDPASPLSRLLDAPIRPGEVVWLGVRPARRAPMQVLERIELVKGSGVVGDRYKSARGTRDVTLIQQEDLAAIAAYLGRAEVDPTELRRNVVVCGLNLRALKDRRFRLGGAVLQATDACHPCSRMEEVLGPGGYNAVRGHGGLLARVLEGGSVGLGDAIARLDEDPA